ncbi:bifunctional diaminohydroxyphosphoribosylaminopyrimidine deaminase/5-amino-6-(5-phosphoribosylamino)uracil reductase RibD [Paraglaciecola aestuariivivens]
MTSFSRLDHQMMASAIALAKRGQYTTSPNPNVGCVITDKSGNILGQGWHKKAGTAHAEVHALNQIKQQGLSPKGATVYVTLEPCSHQGRTPPCADTLIAAGVAKVVVAMVDPNPLVSGKGIAKLQQAGIEVTQGLLSQASAELNRGFIHRMCHSRPWVTVKLAASLDGKTALKNGKSQWITSAAARQDVQRHRAKSCAILSGSGTVMADNPWLNVRYGELNLSQQDLLEEDLRQPLRVILDGRNQLTNQLNCLQPLKGNTGGKVLLINSQINPLPFAEHVSQWQARYNQNRLDLQQIMQKLGELQLNQLWVEAGAKLAGALVKNNLVDELILYQAPKLIGGAGQNLFEMAELESMQDVPILSWQDIRQVGSDIKMTALFNH